MVPGPSSRSAGRLPLRNMTLIINLFGLVNSRRPLLRPSPISRHCLSLASSAKCQRPGTFFSSASRPIQRQRWLCRQQVAWKSPRPMGGRLECRSGIVQCYKATLEPSPIGCLVLKRRCLIRRDVIPVWKSIGVDEMCFLFLAGWLRSLHKKSNAERHGCKDRAKHLAPCFRGSHPKRGFEQIAASSPLSLSNLDCICTKAEHFTSSSVRDHLSAVTMDRCLYLVGFFYGEGP